MKKNPGILNQIKILSLLIGGSIVFQSCGRELYIVGALTKTNLYTYNGKGSGNYNNQGGVSWSAKPGAYFGIGTNVAKISTHLDFRAEVITSFQGAAYENINPDINGAINLVYAYTPMVIRYNHPTGIFGEAGLRPGILLSARDRYNNKSTFYSDYMRKPDLGITAGLGYNLNGKFSFGLRVFQGFSNISEAITDGKSNNAVEFRVTYTLMGKNKESK